MSVRIALVGNPNCGKTTMFNELTGSSQYVGNWPGVTVEKKEGLLKGNKDVIITDLPGIYSLSPYTLEEVVSRDYLIDERPDAIINLVDATNLERNLYLTTQVMELGIPVVIALNMIDLIRRNGDSINIKKLSDFLGCEIIETSALKNKGLKEATEAAIAAAKAKKPVAPVKFGPALEEALSSISGELSSFVSHERLRWFSIKFFERDEKIAKKINLPPAVGEKIENIIVKAEQKLDDDAESIVTNERYEYISSVVSVSAKKAARALTTSDRIDRIVTNRILALPIFAAIIFSVYFISVSWIGTIVTDWTNDVLFGEVIMGAASLWLENIGAAEWLVSLIVDGIIGGVGSVLGFVPQMFVMFFFLSLLEDCGYMARVAFIMDRIFRKFGLSGKSFIPMLISSGCGVPGIMATKTIESEKDRRMTIMTTTFIPCGAKLPVIALIGGAMFPDFPFIAPAMYFIGVGAVIVSGIILKKTSMFAGDPAPFVMELPQYHMPAAKGLLIHMWERGRAFIVKAGTVIFLACAIIWFMSNFAITSQGLEMVEEGQSMLAAVGLFIAPIFAPIGFGNWYATVATISGLIAKENLVGTLGVLLGLGADIAEDDPGLLSQISAIFPYTASALSFLVFNLLCAPCVAAMGAIRREMVNAKWTWFALGYQTVLAYCTALVINQIGGLMQGALTFGPGTVAAIVVIVIFLFLLLRPAPKNKLPNTPSRAYSKSV